MTLRYRALRSRADAIEEIIENSTYHVEKLRGLLVNMPDLIRGLTRVQYGKVSWLRPGLVEKELTCRLTPPSWLLS